MDQLKFITRFPYLIEFQRNKYIGILHLKVGYLTCNLLYITQVRFTDP